MKAPAGAEYDTVGEWRRSPAQPVTLLIGSTNPSLRPARPKPAKSDTEACVRCRSGHDKAKPQSGRISALAGREGRLRACYSILSATLLTTTENPSYNIHHKKRCCSGPLGRGGLAFQWWVPAQVLPLCTVRHSKFLYVVTTGISHARSVAEGATSGFSEPARTSVRCKGGHYYVVHRFFRDR